MGIYLPPIIKKLKRQVRKALNGLDDLETQIANGEIGGGSDTSSLRVTKTITLGTNQNTKAPNYITLYEAASQEFAQIADAFVQIFVPADYALNDGAVSRIVLTSEKTLEDGTIQRRAISSEITYDSDETSPSADLQVRAGRGKIQKFVLNNEPNGRTTTGPSVNLDAFTDRIVAQVLNLGTVGASGDEIIIQVDAQIISLDVIPTSIN